MAPPVSPLHIGDWLFLPASFELVRGDERRRLPRRLGAVLARLAAQPGEVVSRESLLADVWQRRGVTHDVLSRAINELRLALDDERDTPAYIETIPKSGYRLIALVRPFTPSVADASPAHAKPVPAERTDLPARPWLLAIAVVVIAAGALVLLAVRSDWDGGPEVPRHDENRSPPAIELDIAAERPLSSKPGWETGPALSPDARLLAYAEAAPDDTRTILVLQALDGSARRVLDDEAGSVTRPRFSPDGRWIAYRVRTPESCEIRARPVLAGSSRFVAACGPPFSGPAWSAQGTHLAFTAPAEPGAAPGLALVEFETGVVRALTRPALEDGADVDPEFVPGSSRISFARGDASDRSLLWLDTQASEAAPGTLMGGGNLIHGHAWTPDGGTVIVATDASGFRLLLAIDAGTLRQRALGARGARYPHLGSNGLLLYELANYDANIWRVDFAGPRAGRETRLTDSSRYDASPALSPDGQRYLFVSLRDGLESVWLAPLEGEDPPQRLPLDPALRWVRPVWSPDGRAVFATAYGEHGTAVFRHELESGRTQELDGLGPEAFGGMPDAEGRVLVFGRRHGNALTLWQAPLQDEGSAAELPGATAVDEFRVGRGLVAYSRSARPGLRLFSLEDHTTRDLPVPIGEDNRYDWLLQERSIWYVARDAGGRGMLHRHDIDSGATTPVGPAEPNAVAPTLSVRPDASLALFARVDSLTIDLMAVPLRKPPP